MLQNKMGQTQKIIMMRDSINATSLQNITDMMLQGKSKISIVKHIKDILDKQFPNATMNAANSIYNDILKKVNAALEEDRPTITSNLYTRLNYLYRKSLEQKDITNARGCLMDIAKVTGVTGNNNSVEIKNNDQEIKISFGFGE